MHYRAVGYWGPQKTDWSLKQGGGPISLLFVFWQGTWSSEGSSTCTGTWCRSRPPPVFCSWHLPCQVSALFLIVFVLLFVFPPDSLLCPHSPFCHSNHHHASLFFPLLLISYSSLPVTVHTHTHTWNRRGSRPQPRTEGSSEVEALQQCSVCEHHSKQQHDNSALQTGMFPPAVEWSLNGRTIGVISIQRSVGRVTDHKGQLPTSVQQN